MTDTRTRQDRLADRLWLFAAAVNAKVDGPAFPAPDASEEEVWEWLLATAKLVKKT